MRNKNFLFLLLLFVCVNLVGCGAGAVGAGAIYDEAGSDSNEININGSFSLLDMIIPKVYANNDLSPGQNPFTDGNMTNGQMCFWRLKYFKKASDWGLKIVECVDMESGSFEFSFDSSRFPKSNCLIGLLCGKSEDGSVERCKATVGELGTTTLALNASTADDLDVLQTLFESVKSRMENKGGSRFCTKHTGPEMKAILAAKLAEEKAAKDAAAKAAADAAAAKAAADAAKAAAAKKAPAKAKAGGAMKAKGGMKMGK